MASITALKQLRSSTGKLPGPPLGGGAMPPTSVPPSRRGHPGGFRPALPNLRGPSPSDQISRGQRGPNAAWTGTATLPCPSSITPMYGKSGNPIVRNQGMLIVVIFAGEVVNQHQHDKRQRELLRDLSGYADGLLTRRD